MTKNNCIEIHEPVYRERNVVMYYSSTRGDAEKKTSAEAILEGLAADGGLFVPSEIPQLGLPFVESMLGLSYE